MSLGRITKQELSTELYNDLKQEELHLNTTPADVEVSGRTLVNLLGRAGNAIYKQSDKWNEDYFGSGSKIEFNKESFVLNVENQGYGCMALSVNTEGVAVSNDCFLFAGYVKTNGDGGLIQIRQDYTPEIPQKKDWENTTQNFKFCYVAFYPETTVFTVDLVAENANATIKDLRLYKITPEIYNKINTDEEYTGDKLAQKYPYVDDVKCVVNPYFETKDMDFESRMMFETTLYDGEKITRDNSGRYVKNSEWDELIIDANKMYQMSMYKNTGTGNRGVMLHLPEAPNDWDRLDYSKNIVATRYDGSIMHYDGTAQAENSFIMYWGEKAKRLFVSAPNSLTGWGDSYTPTQEEIKAFFLGWRMCPKIRRDIPYTTGEKGWVKLWCGIGEKGQDGDMATSINVLGSTICPTTINDMGYTPYKVIYKKEIPSIEEVKTHGSLVVKEGVDVKVGSGLVLGEKGKIQLHTDGLYYINATYSLTQNRLFEVLKVKDTTYTYPITNYINTSSNNIILKGDGYATYSGKSDNEPITIEYLIYKPDTVQSFPHTILTPNNTKEVLEKTIEELSNTNEKLSAENRALHDKIESLPQASNPNLLINGDFQVWQRGESFTYTPYTYTYTADRWHLGGDMSSKAEKHIDGGMKITAIADTIGRDTPVVQCVEPHTVKAIRGKNITLSLDLMKSSDVSDVVINIYYSTVENEIYGSTNRINHQRIIKASELQITPKRFTLDGGVVPNDVKSIVVLVRFGSATGGTPPIKGSWFVMNNVKLELGNKATPYTPRPYGEELALCKRYYQKLPNGFRVRVHTVASNSIACLIGINEMRTTPTATINECILLSVNGSVQSDFTFAVSGGNTTRLSISANKSAHGLTDGTLSIVDVALDAEIY